MDTPQPAPRGKPSWRRRVAREVAFYGTLALILLSARSSLADHYAVPTGSMLPTVEVGDHVLVNKLAYGLRIPFTDTWTIELGAPERGDVVVLRSPEDGRVLLKRVVAVPGDVITVRNGHIAIGGVQSEIAARAGELREQLGGGWHKVRLDHGGGRDLGPLHVPSGRYLVMGDNRGDSHDGRHFGLVARASIVGRAVGVFWRDGLAWRDLHPRR